MRKFWSPFMLVIKVSKNSPTFFSNPFFEIAFVVIEMCSVAPAVSNSQAR